MSNLLAHLLRGWLLIALPFWLHSQTLPTPVLLAPTNGSNIQASNVTLRWNATPGANQYKVALGTTPIAEGSIVWDTTYTDTARLVTSLPNGTYYWRIKAKHAANPYQTSAWSGIRSFTLSSAPPPLAAPTLVSPANNATGQPASVTLNWQAVAGANQYKISVGTTPAATGTTALDTAFAGTSFALNNLAPGQYYWKVAAKHASNPYQVSAWSGVWSFSVASPSGPLPTPVLVSPANGIINQPTNMTLTWQAVPGADQYKVSVSTPNHSNDVAWDSSYVGTSYQLNNLPPGSYLWRIKAKHSTNPYQSSAWSATWIFTVGNNGGNGGNGGGGSGGGNGGGNNGLTAPVLASPSNNSTLQVLGTNLAWNAVSGATFYKVKVAMDANMTNVIFQDNNVTATNRVAQSLGYSTQYFWTVQAANAASTGPVSSTKTFTTMPNNPNALTTHPRLLITQADLPTLQAWAVPSNPVFVSLQNALNTAIANYNSFLFPGGQPNPNYPDNGGTTWSGYVSESYAEFFAFWSLIDPNVNNRPIHAQRARNLLMYVIDRAILGPSPGVPFRDPQFSMYDRSRVYGEGFGLTVDWIYNAKDANNNDILTAADKAKIRTVFLRWCNEQLTAYNHPTPVGLLNDKQIQVTNRWILNNYYSGHARNLTFMALSMDAADDPAVNQSLHFSALGNSLRSYIYNVTGAWLYQQYAQYEKPEIVAADYGISPTGLGMGSGGCSVEGSLYGESVGWVAQEVLALKKAGWMDENIIGKQAKLFSSDYWTKMVESMLHTAAPAAKVPPTQSYLGPVYFAANYGDLLRTWVTPELLDAVAPIGLIDMNTGSNQPRLDKVRWYARNVLQGGSGNLAQRISNIWPNCNAIFGIYYYLLLPPTDSNPPDPRPTMPTTFWDPNFGRLLSRTDWTANASWFDWQCHWTKINHQVGDNNQFEFYRNGEWLIKEKSGYTNDNIGTTSEFHNTLGLQNDVPPNMQWYENPISQRGGQWKEGLNAGDPTNIVSTGNPEYVYATGDATNLYNRYTGATDIEYANRSIVWLKPDYVVVYDRAKSFTANRFKRFFLQFTAMPSVTGKNVTVNTPGGQKVFLSNLLPAASVLTAFPTESLDVTAELESAVGELKIEDPSNPQNVRFLNVIQGADGNAAKNTATLVQSTSGTAFDGTVVNNTAVMFPNVWGGSFTSTAYSTPNTVNLHIVTGLTPNAGYEVTLTPNGSNTDVSISPGSQLTADAGGVLVIVPSNFNGTNAQDRSSEASKTEAENLISLEINPNPLTESTVIRYELKEAGRVSIQVFDMTGKLVNTLIDREDQMKGLHQVTFKADGLAAGTYFCTLSIGDVQTTRLMVVNK